MIAASARMRSASAGVFAVAASLSRLTPMALSCATSLRSERDASTLSMARFQRRNPLGRKSVAAGQLVEIGAGNDEI